MDNSNTKTNYVLNGDQWWTLIILTLQLLTHIDALLNKVTVTSGALTTSGELSTQNGFFKQLIDGIVRDNINWFFY